jgi:NADPH-dependent curcumin reductase CurA
MEASENLQVTMARHPAGWVEESDFALVRTPLPRPGPGQMLVRVRYLSLDPYMRGRMNPGKSYAAGIGPGDVMPGGTVGEVIASDLPKFPVGTMVLGMFGWQSHALSDGKGVQRVDPAVPLSLHLGALGMPGVTAHVGLLDIGKPRPGETVVVSAASGAVGGVVGQIAKLKGARAVGIAGGAEKCRIVREEYGFDACVDYKAADFYAQLRAATPDGVDVYFENVGGEVLDQVLRRINVGARIPLCGLISEYNTETPHGARNLRSLLVNRATITGFIVSDHVDRWPAALAELTAWWREGKLKAREDVVEGLENAPRAFIGLLKGANKGKLVVKVA